MPKTAKDRKKAKRGSPIPGRNNFNNMLKHSVLDMKHQADFAEQSAICHHGAAELAIKAAVDAKNLAKMMCKTAKDRKTDRWEFALTEGNTLYNNMLQDSFPGMKHSSNFSEQAAIPQQDAADAKTYERSFHNTMLKTANNQKKARLKSPLPVDMKHKVDFAEQSAICQQKAAVDAKNLAKMMCKAAKNRKRARRESRLPEGNTSYNKNMLQDSRPGMKHSADFTDQAAICQQEAANAKTYEPSLKKMHKIANDHKKSRRDSQLSSEGNTFNNMPQDSHLGLKHQADFTEQSADFAEQSVIFNQKAADLAIKAATDAKTLAKEMRKTADDQEKALLECPLPEGNTFYNNMLQDSLRDMKYSADVAEQIAINQQENAERAIKLAANVKTAAEMIRKAANNRQMARREVGEGESDTIRTNFIPYDQLRIYDACTIC